MFSPQSLTQFLCVSLLSSLPVLTAAQEASPLQSCLANSGISAISSANDTWTASTTAWQLRIKPNPNMIAYPTTQDQLAATLGCARESSSKISAMTGGHSFGVFGFGNDGNLVVNMSAFNTMVYDEATTTLKYGAGLRVGPVAKYLWDTHGRHIPHPRSGAVGLAGSSIGGGFGSTSRFLGTPMNNLVSVEYMLYNGTIVNAPKGSDIFWAASGAGSSLGVIMSLTSKTHVPPHKQATSFAIGVGRVSIDVGVKAILASQEFALNEAPNEFALRWSLTATPYAATGQYYGDPADFDAMIKPLMDRLPANTTLTKTVSDFWALEQTVAGGINDPNGGYSAPRAFYTQSLTTTTDHPLTYDLIYSLFDHTTYNFNRTDMTRSGLLDLCGGVSSEVSDTDSALLNAKNLWLIRVDGVGSNLRFPSDGVQYMKGLMEPFERDLIAANIPLRGFGNYRDTNLTEAQWSERLYGPNYPKLLAVKASVDPEGFFTSNLQSIPVSK